MKKYKIIEIEYKDYRKTNVSERYMLGLQFTYKFKDISVFKCGVLDDLTLCIDNDMFTNFKTCLEAFFYIRKKINNKDSGHKLNANRIYRNNS